MDADLKTKMNDDFERRLDLLFGMKLQPLLHLSQKFDSIINSIDLHAERILELGVHSKEAEWMNENRCEFVRILKALEKHLQTQLGQRETRELGEDFEALQKRVEEFRELPKSASQGDDINHWEDLYVQLVLEISEMTQAEESKIFGNQTVFYLSSTDHSRLGNLFHLSGVSLTNDLMDYIRLYMGRVHKVAGLHHIHETTEALFNQSLVVSVKLPFIVTKEMLVVKSVMLQLETCKNNYPQLVRLVSSNDKDLVYSVDAQKVSQISLKQELVLDHFDGEPIERLNIDIKETVYKSLFLSRSSLKNFHSGTLSGLEVLERLELSDNQLEHLDENAMAKCTSLHTLLLPRAFHCDAKFSLSFLPSISQNLRKLMLTLPDGPVDFSVFGQMSELEYLVLIGASSLDADREVHKLAMQQLFQINTNKLDYLQLSHFNLSAIDQETLKGFDKLTSLALTCCRIASIHPGAFMDNVISLESLNLSCNLISELSDKTFTGLTLLKKLDLGRNQISFLSDNAFICCHSLTSLDLRFNQISRLSSGCFRGLPKLQYLILHGNQIPYFPPAVFEGLGNLNELDLSCNKLNRVDRELFKGLERLFYLMLDGNPIESIVDDAFSSCSQLGRLSLSHCLLKTIHNRMLTGLAHSLRFLNLGNNLIESFQIRADGCVVEIKSANMTPRELEMARKHLFHGFDSLRIVQLQGNKFTKLDVRAFSNLRYVRLDLSSNEIDELNNQGMNEIRDYCIDLDLCKNQLACVTENLFLRGVHLKLNDNPIRALDADLSTPLDTSNSRFNKQLADSIFKSSIKPPIVDLIGLAMVAMDYNRFLASNSQPQAIQSILEKRNGTDTKHLSLNNFLLKTLDALELPTRFPNLTTLNLRWNSLDRFETCWIQGINNLHNLSLQNNQIETLNDATLFASCSNLKDLDLSKNSLKAINRRLFHGLCKLESLNLSNNPELSNIDDGLFRSLFSVTKIDFTGNNIKQLNLPRLFKSCPRLVELDLSNNQLDNRTFSHENVRHLSNLQTLLLNDNQLENIEFVRDLTRLERLELKNNIIGSIEKDGCNLLGRLRFLWYLDISNNFIQSLSKNMWVHLESKLKELNVSGNLFHSEHQLRLRLE